MLKSIEVVVQSGPSSDSKEEMHDTLEPKGEHGFARNKTTH